MFNLGLFELGLFGVIALIVLGPEKLIITARTLGKWYGNFRRLSARLQNELVSELELHEVQNALKAEIDEIRASEANIQAQMQALQAKLHQADQMARTQTMPSSHPPQSGDLVTASIQDGNQPLTNRFFLLGDYDKKRRLPPPPFMPNHKADTLLSRE